MDIAQAVEESTRLEDVLADKPTSGKAGRSKRPEDTVHTEPTGLLGEGAKREERPLPVSPGVVEGQVMGGLTIRELEMMRKLDEISQLEEIPVGGTTNIEPEVIGAIAGVAAQSIQGVASLGTASLRRTIRERMGGAEKRSRGVEVEAGRKEAILDINVRVIYGYSIPKTVIQVRHIVADRLLRLCGIIAKEINVRVIGIDFPDRMPGRVE